MLTSKVDQNRFRKFDEKERALCVHLRNKRIGKKNEQFTTYTHTCLFVPLKILRILNSIDIFSNVNIAEAIALVMSLKLEHSRLTCRIIKKKKRTIRCVEVGSVQNNGNIQQSLIPAW